MKRGTIVEIIMLVFVVLFLYTGISKIMDYYVFKEQLALSPILAPFADWIAIGLPAIEIILSVILFIPFTRVIGFYASLILMGLFTGYVIYVLNFDRHLPCTCGGFIQEFSWPQHLVFNIILLILALTGIILSGRLKFKEIVKSSNNRRISACIVICFLYTACKRPTIKTGLEGKPLPELVFKALDSVTRVSTADLKTGRPIVLFYFSPHCPYCRAQVSEMIKSIDILSGIRICMVSDYPPAELNQFINEYKLSKYSNITVAYDPKYDFASYFNAVGVPYTAIYGKKMKLNGVYIGPATSRDILETANE